MAELEALEDVSPLSPISHADQEKGKKSNVPSSFVKGKKKVVISLSKDEEEEEESTVGGEEVIGEEEAPT